MKVAGILKNRLCIFFLNFSLWFCYARCRHTRMKHQISHWVFKSTVTYKLWDKTDWNHKIFVTHTTPRQCHDIMIDQTNTCLNLAIMQEIVHTGISSKNFYYYCFSLLPLYFHCIFLLLINDSNKRSRYVKNGW